MARRLTIEDDADISARFARGQSAAQIALAFDTSVGSVVARIRMFRDNKLPRSYASSFVQACKRQHRIAVNSVELDPILSSIERFLARGRLSAAAFGIQALNDPTLVYELRRGREVRRSTRNRILEFIRSQDGQNEDAA